MGSANFIIFVAPKLARVCNIDFKENVVKQSQP